MAIFKTNQKVALEWGHALVSGAERARNYPERSEGSRRLHLRSCFPTFICRPVVSFWRGTRQKLVHHDELLLHWHAARKWLAPQCQQRVCRLNGTAIEESWRA